MLHVMINCAWLRSSLTEAVFFVCSAQQGSSRFTVGGVTRQNLAAQAERKEDFRLFVRMFASHRFSRFTRRLLELLLPCSYAYAPSVVYLSLK